MNKIQVLEVRIKELETTMDEIVQSSFNVIKYFAKRYYEKMD